MAKQPTKTNKELDNSIQLIDESREEVITAQVPVESILDHVDPTGIVEELPQPALLSIPPSSPETTPILLIEPVLELDVKTSETKVIPQPVESEKELLTSNTSIAAGKTLLQETEDSVKAAKNKPGFGWWYGR